MGRFLLQFEDQSRPLRAEKDLTASVLFILRTTATIIVLGCAASAISSFATGDEKFLARLIDLIRA